jgi:hypothetical protein
MQNIERTNLDPARIKHLPHETDASA